MFWEENGTPASADYNLRTKELKPNYPSSPGFSDDPEVPFGSQGPQPPAPLEPHQPPRLPGPPGIPLRWPPAPSPAGGREKELEEKTHRVSDYIIEPSLLEPQLIPVPMSDGEDDHDQPPQGERKRQRSRSREQVYPHVPVPQEPQKQPMGTPESDDEISDEDLTIVDSSSPISWTTTIS